MVASNPQHVFSGHISERQQTARRLAERLSRYFDEHPQVSREDFLLGAIQREIDLRMTQYELPPLESGHWERRRNRRISSERGLPTADDLQIHHRLAERLALLNRERSGWWPQARRRFQRWWATYRFG